MSVQLTIKNLKAKMELKKTMDNEVVLKSSGLENGVNASRKRQSSTPMKNVPKRMAPAIVPDEESMFQRRNCSTKVYAGRKKTTGQNTENSNFNKPSQIMRNCRNIPFGTVKPAFQQCASSQKLEFINKNLYFAKDVDDIFREMTIAEFQGITKLPIRFSYWYKYYESLASWTKNEEVSKLEELIAKAAENKKQAEHARKTVVIVKAHTGKRCRPTEISVRRSTSTAQQPSIAQNSVGIQKSTAIKTTAPQSTKNGTSAEQHRKPSNSIKSTVPRVARKPSTKPAPMWAKVQKQIMKMRK